MFVSEISRDIVIYKSMYINKIDMYVCTQGCRPLGTYIYTYYK